MPESIAHFAVKSIGLSRVNGRKPCTLLEAARHNLREIQAEQGATGRIDPTRTNSNAVLYGPARAAEVQAQARALLASGGINAEKLRRDHCQAIEAVFSYPQDAAINDGAAYFAKCLEWLAAAMRLPVLSAVVHRDESAQHLHVLLLPLEDGAHVGSAPIDRAALKRLREKFFAKVAGPAGLKRQDAKVRGMVKQWVVVAVLHRCEALGLPDANGPLWPVWVAAIKRDPTAAMLALGLEVNTIRPPDEQPQANPIGIAPKPIGIESEGAKHRTLSCVGIAHRSLTKEQQKAVETLAELWALVGCKPRVKPLDDDRLKVARAAQQRAIERQASRAHPDLSMPKVRMDDDGVTRIRDEYAHDLSAWD